MNYNKFMKDVREVIIGIIKAPKGLKGEVKIIPYVASLERYNTVESAILELPGGRRLKVTLQYWYPHQKGVVIKFREIEDRTTAEKLKDAAIKVPAETSPQLPEGEFYHYQLIGLDVQTTDGRYIGTVKEIMETGASDIFVVRGQKTEYLIPVVEKFIEEIDLEAGVIKIKPVEGILEVYEG